MRFPKATFLLVILLLVNVWELFLRSRLQQGLLTTKLRGDSSAAPGAAATTDGSDDTSDDDNTDGGAALTLLTTATCPEEEDTTNTTMLVHVPAATPQSAAYDMVLYGKNDIISDHINRFGAWEGPMTNRFIQTITAVAKERNVSDWSELIFVDIGANVGWFTYRMASLGVQVHAFEPMPSNRRLIKATSCHNPMLAARITLHETALSSQASKDHTCIVYSDNVNQGDGILKCSVGGDDEGQQSFVPPAGYSVRGTVPIHTLDDFELDTTRIAAVKIDVEGHEPMVLQGGTKTLLSSGIPMIVTEFSPKFIKAAGLDPAQFLTDFYTSGYSIDTMSLEQVLNKYLNMGGLTDLVFEYKGR